LGFSGAGFLVGLGFFLLLTSDERSGDERAEGVAWVCLGISCKCRYTIIIFSPVVVVVVVAVVVPVVVGRFAVLFGGGREEGRREQSAKIKK
jgi:hypothetical protein